MNNVRRLARALGWFSVGLGSTELLAGREVARALGTPRGAGLTCLFGLREIGVGVAILVDPRPAPGWLWARVAGDALDLGALGVTLESTSRDKKDHVLLALAAVTGVTALDILCARQLGRGQGELFE